MRIGIIRNTKLLWQHDRRRGHNDALTRPIGNGLLIVTSMDLRVFNDSLEYAVVSPYGGSLQFFLLEKGYYPVHAGEIRLGRGSAAVAFQKSYLYAVAGDLESSDFYTIDISTAKGPTIVGTSKLPPTALRLRVAGNYAYVTGDRNLGLTIDISNPNKPALVGEWPIIGIPSSIWVIGNYLYLIDEDVDVLQVIDISNPLQPINYDFSLLEDGRGGGGHTCGAVSDGFAYIVSTATGYLRIIRLPEIGT